MKKYSILLFTLLLTLSSCDYFEKANAVEHKLRKIENNVKTISREVKAINNELTKEQSSAKESETSSKKKKTSTSQLSSSILTPKERKDISELILYRHAYICSYNSEKGIPNWVAWHLTSDHVTGPYKREGIKFHEDEDTPRPWVNTYDYNRSGYDRGHMCPSGDNKWSQLAQEQSFLMSNMCPQNHNLNTGDWNEMENQCRKWAKKYGSVDIVCGPIFIGNKHKRIGTHKVMVPEAFFKVVLCREGGKPKAIGFIYRNTEGNRPKDAYVNSVDDVERITGYDFFSQLPDEVEKRVEKEANLSDWN